nr:SH3 domain-containing protein [uncultured Ralstonia sp.]
MEKLNAITVGGMLARELAKLEQMRSSWRNSLIQSDTLSRQLQELAQAGSTYARLVKDLKALQSPLISLTQQYKDLLREGSIATQAVKAWQESQRLQQESVRRMLGPLDDIRKNFLMGSATQQFIKELANSNAVRDQFKTLVDQTSGVGSPVRMLAQQLEESRPQTKSLLGDLSASSSVQAWLKNFERANKQWMVPSEVLGMVESFKSLHAQLGKVALPTIDWGSAAALAKTLGQEGIEEQLAKLGIEPGGSLHEFTALPEKGILSRKQADAVTLVSLLLGLLFFIYQEISGQQDKTKTDAFQAQAAERLQTQAQQIHQLTVLIEKTLAQAAQEPEELFVVRERTATVRSKPEHGSKMEGKLLPNEVVRALDRQGKWIEVEYYHWLNGEYRTGWVLKKYLERVPVNYSKNSE